VSAIRVRYSRLFAIVGLSTAGTDNSHIKSRASFPARSGNES
jgi:hypothetical protein